MSKYFALLALVAVVKATPFTSCGTGGGKITKLVIDGCDDATPRCILHKGNAAKISMTFTPNANADKVKVKAYGIIAGIPIPYALPNNDACAGSLSCPIQKDALVVYSQSFDVQQSYPSISLNVKWILADNEDNEIVCALIPVKLQ